MLAAKHATMTLPIVAAVMTDPVEAGIVESLAHPGGNITGSFLSRLELEVKRLELLKEALPGVTRVAVFLKTRDGSKRWSAPPRNWGQLHPVEVRGPNDVERLERDSAGRLRPVVSDASLLGMHAEQIGDFVVEQRLPTIGASGRYLMAYG